MSGLDWNNILGYKCPKCARIMADKPAGYECTGKSVSDCDFFITKDRFIEIVRNLQGQNKEKIEEGARPQRQFRPSRGEVRRKRI